MRVVYIAAPLSAPTREEMDANRARAARWCAWAARQGVAPIATWIVLSGELSETQENRELGLAIDCATVERCDEVWLVGGRVTSGMRRESEHGRFVLDLTFLGEEPPEHFDWSEITGRKSSDELRAELVSQGGYRSGRKIC